MDVVITGFWVYLLPVIGFLMAAIIIARLMEEQRHPGNAMAWLLLIILVPYIGVPLYLLLGSRKFKKLVARKPPLYHPRPLEKPAHAELEQILVSSGAPMATTADSFLVLSTGEQAYHCLMNEIRQARDHIYITTFILGRDKVARSIITLLAAKAAEGVKVRLLVDSLGSFLSRGRFVNVLRLAGGEVASFMPVLPLYRRWGANLRNHRKIVLIDGRCALLGGMNLSREYMGPVRARKRWMDFSMLVQGDVVHDLYPVFAADWKFATDSAVHIPARKPTPATEQGSLVQVVASGPDVPYDALYEGVLLAILRAKDRIWIVTPYFVPDTTLHGALGMMARLGRDVRIIVPRKSDHLLPDLARDYYLRDLAQQGVKILGYDVGMLHAKLMLIDDETGVAGSANFDMRSFYFNYEIALFIHSSPQTVQIQDYVESLFPSSSPMEFAEIGFRAKLKKWAEHVGRLFAPLL